MNIHTRRFLWHSLHSGQKKPSSMQYLQSASKKKTENFAIIEFFECTPYALSYLQGIFKKRYWRYFRQATRLPDCISHFYLAYCRMEHINVALLCTLATLSTRPSKEMNFAESGTKNAHGVAGCINSLFGSSWWPFSTFNGTLVVKIALSRFF